MDDHEAMLALAAPEPEPFTQTRPTPEDNARWQVWHDNWNAALAYARMFRSRSLADYAHPTDPGIDCMGC